MSDADTGTRDAVGGSVTPPHGRPVHTGTEVTGQDVAQVPPDTRVSRPGRDGGRTGDTIGPPTTVHSWVWKTDGVGTGKYGLRVTSGEEVGGGLQRQNYRNSHYRRGRVDRWGRGWAWHLRRVSYSQGNEEGTSRLGLRPPPYGTGRRMQEHRESINRYRECPTHTGTQGPVGGDVYGVSDLTPTGADTPITAHTRPVLSTDGVATGDVDTPGARPLHVVSSPPPEPRPPERGTG